MNQQVPSIKFPCSRHGPFTAPANQPRCPKCAAETKPPVTGKNTVVPSPLTLTRLFTDIEHEAVTGATRFGAFNSCHEGFAVLLEEVDELKAHVWAKQKNRDLEAMRREAIQVAAMAVRFALELCTEERGRR